MQIDKYVFQPFHDNRGQLIAIEEYKDIPFSIKRVYYIYGVEPGVVRGYHAHKSLQQVLICVHGSCKVLVDNGKEKEVITLERPSEGLYIPSSMWREMFDFSANAVLMVLASDIYNEEDYIRNYEEFLCYVEKQNQVNSADEEKR